MEPCQPYVGAGDSHLGPHACRASAELVGKNSLASLLAPGFELFKVLVDYYKLLSRKIFTTLHDQEQYTKMTFICIILIYII